MFKSTSSKLVKRPVRRPAKKIAILAAIITISLGTDATTGWSAGKTGEKSGNKTQTVSFKKGMIYDIAYFSVKSGKEKQLNEDYFPQALRIGKDYGVSMLASFGVTDVTAGDISPQMVAIFEWPSLAVKERFEKDKRYKKIVPLRDASLSFIKVAFYEVAEDVEVVFRDDKSYEFFGAWLTPEAETFLPKYFEVSEPIKRTYGRPYPEFKVNFALVKNAPKGDFSYAPHMAGIVEWDKSEDFQVLNSNKRFQKEAAPLMAKALTRIDMLHTKLQIKL